VYAGPLELNFKPQNLRNAAETRLSLSRECGD